MLKETYEFEIPWRWIPGVQDPGMIMNLPVIPSEEEIEELEGVVDDDVLRSAVAGVMNSDDIGTEIQNHLDEYLSEEDMRRSLDRILDAAGMTLTAQQVCDMAQDMYEDVADVLVRDVVDRGMKFTTDQVMQLIDIVTQPVMEHLVSHTEGPFSEAELDRLDGKINDLLLADVTGLSDDELELADEMIDEVRHSETDERKERKLKRAMDAYVYFSWDQACDMAVLLNQENAEKLIRHKVEYAEKWDYCTPDQVSALYDVLSGPVLDLMITKAKGTFSKEHFKAERKDQLENTGVNRPEG